MSPHLSASAESATAPLLVACLCAQWCGTCKDYQPLFTALQAEFPGARMRWVDVEDEADLVDPIEVENFPTLLIAQGERATFFGTVTPHLETLRRLIQSSAADGAPTVRDAEVQALVQRLGVR
ncbi:MAG: thioredoxin [Betaproteobacteria bacterium]|nr:thioredoxin [Betaproteobacteria bacterium]